MISSVRQHRKTTIAISIARGTPKAERVALAAYLQGSGIRPVKRRGRTFYVEDDNAWAEVWICFLFSAGFPLAPELIDDDGSPRTESTTTGGDPSSSSAARRTETS